MIEYFKTDGDKLCRVDGSQENCWINVVAPTEQELFRLSADASVGIDYLRAALDEEEASRIETGSNGTMILIGVPLAQKHENTVSYSVVPMSIIITDRFIITVCTRQNTIISDFSEGLIKNVQTAQKTRFVLQILMRMSVRFIQYLRQIKKIAGFIENQLYGTLRNKELVQLFGLEKSLIYFSASLKASEITLEKILRGRVIRLNNDEHDLLEDVLIEIKQAVDMSGIYSRVLSGTINAFSTVRANNLNHVLKQLITVLVLISVPLAVFGFYGMNVVGINKTPFVFPILISAVGMLSAGILLYHKRMF
ncbi:MAG TPA: magnesium transporter CorA family protein [Ruminiclostridium sp.]|nr:magnesium transporter CorA family protein [Ruminiclostridium sp.]